MTAKPAHSHPGKKASDWQWRQGCRHPDCIAEHDKALEQRSQQRRAKKAGSGSSPAGSSDLGEIDVAGLEKAVNDYLKSAATSDATADDLVIRVYGQVIITLTRTISRAESKDVPKLVEQLVDVVKLLQPANADGKNNVLFGGLGTPT